MLSRLVVKRFSRTSAEKTVMGTSYLSTSSRQRAQFKRELAMTIDLSLRSPTDFVLPSSSSSSSSTTPSPKEQQKAHILGLKQFEFDRNVESKGILSAAFGRKSTLQEQCESIEKASRLIAQNTETQLKSALDASETLKRLMEEADLSLETTRNTLQELAQEIVHRWDEVSQSLCSIADPAECLRLLHPHEHVRDAATRAVESLSNIFSRLNGDPNIFSSLKQLLDFHNKTISLSSSPPFPLLLSEEQVRQVDLLVKDLVKQGIHVQSKDGRKTLNDLQYRNLKLSHLFESNVISPPARDIDAIASFSAPLLSSKLSVSDSSAVINSAISKYVSRFSSD